MKVSIPNPLHGVSQVHFESGLSEIELVHAKATAATSFKDLHHIANRMNEKNISYREAFLELHNEGII